MAVPSTICLPAARMYNIEMKLSSAYIHPSHIPFQQWVLQGQKLLQHPLKMRDFPPHKRGCCFLNLLAYMNVDDLRLLLWWGCSGSTWQIASSCFALGSTLRGTSLSVPSYCSHRAVPGPQLPIPLQFMPQAFWHGRSRYNGELIPGGTLYREQLIALLRVYLGTVRKASQDGVFAVGTKAGWHFIAASAVMPCLPELAGYEIRICGTKHSKGTRICPVWILFISLSKTETERWTDRQNICWLPLH